MRVTTRIIYGLVTGVLLWFDLKTVVVANSFITGTLSVSRVFLFLMLLILHFVMMLSMVSMGSLALVGEKFVGTDGGIKAQ